MPDTAKQVNSHQPRHLTSRNRFARMAIRPIPLGEWRANRYDTDDEHVLHLHNEKGDSYDIRVPKVKAERG